MEINEDFSSLLYRYAKAVGAELDDSQVRLFIDYLEELNLWNRRINLVSSNSATDVLIKHFIDSLTALQFINKRASRIIDIGSGAGFPGIPLKIALPGLRFTLLEVSRKRGSFLKNVIRKLGLADIAVLNKRVQDVMESRIQLGAFDTVISRAAFKIPELVHMAGHFLADNGTLLVMKGMDIDIEIAEADMTAQGTGLIYTSCHDLVLPLTGSLRKIVIYRKHK